MNIAVNKLKQNKGITMVALVVTIILMLILLTVTIANVGEGKIFKHAGNAVKGTETYNERKNIQTTYLTLVYLSSTGSVEEEEFNAELEQFGATAEATENGFIIRCASGNEYILDINGDIRDNT